MFHPSELNICRGYNQSTDECDVDVDVEFGGSIQHPPPYGLPRMSDPNSAAAAVFLDHIYETIDQDDPTPPHSGMIPSNLPSAFPRFTSADPAECHVRSRSDASHQSNSSLGCDRRPLIQRAGLPPQDVGTTADFGSCDPAVTDPALVMAVFENDRVRCRLQAVNGRPGVKVAAKHPCQPSAHLSTDC